MGYAITLHSLRPRLPSAKHEHTMQKLTFVNVKPSEVQLKLPDALVFVIDGTDRGRLALAAKISNDLLERYHRADALLVLITKSHELAPSDILSGHSSILEISPRRLPLLSTGLPSPTVRAPGSASSDAMEEDHDAVSYHALRSSVITSETTSSKSGHMGVASKSTACTLSQVKALMAQPSLLQKNWAAFYCSAETGEGLQEAFRWLVDVLRNRGF